VILYLDTSAVVKLYVEEAGSRAVSAGVAAADAICTVRIAYAEARAAFARGRRESLLTPRQLRELVRGFDEDWPRYTVIEISQALVRRAGGLAERRALRGYDAVHLAAALEVRDAGEAPAFACFDDRLAKAAAAEGLDTFNHRP